MNKSSTGLETQALALSAEYASLPMPSPATSIILAEAVLHSREARESQRRTRPFVRFIQKLLNLARSADLGLPGKVSIVFTPCGPLAYRWNHYPDSGPR